MDENYVANATTDNGSTDEFSIVIDDGAVEIPIRNTFGEQIGLFRFHPTDVNIVNRYNEVAEKFEKVLDPLVNANISANGEGEDSESVRILNEASDRMGELMDYVLNANSKEAFFQKTHMFAPIQGSFYCEKVYAAIGSYISRQFDAEVKRVNKRVIQHTHGYRTGSHKKGKA